MRLYLISLLLIYGNLPHIKFLSHFNYFIPLPEVQSMSRPFDGFLTCVLRNKELVIMVSSKIMTSELVIPSWIPFHTIIYEPILIPFILTWSLCDTPPPTKVSPDLRLKKWLLNSLTYHVVYSSMPQ